VKRTRDQIRELLAARGEATAGEISGLLRLNAANIRRHLEAMRAEGLVDIRLERREVGRPSHVYRLTERAEELNGHYPRLLNRLVRRLVAMPEAEPLVAQVFDGVAEDVAAAHLAEVRGRTVEERVVETSLALKDEGIVDHWVRAEDGYHLMNTTCPYRKAAEVSDAPCRSDTKVVAALVGAPVEQVSRIVDGQPVCEYVVKAGAPVTLYDESPTSRGSL